MKTTTTEVIIIGGGLAGLCASIHLAKKGRKVVLIEKNEYPRHKVCGEYVSNEVLPYLNYLGFNPFAHGAKKIKEFELSTRNGKRIATQLPLGGFGISRFQLDYELYQLSKSHGVRFVKDRVQYLNYTDNSFSVATKSSGSFYSKLVIGAFGKRSNLDMAMQRKFVKKKSPYLAVKMHSSGDFPDDKVALHNFKGGYCGVSKVENDHINLCYISSFKAFQPYKDISRFQEKVLFKNEALKEIFQNTVPQFEEPLTISQISFETKAPVENHVLMCGDSAGMIHPLCGNGMGMAIRSAHLVSVCIIEYLEGKIKSRKALEQRYSNKWFSNFRLRLKVGHTIAYLFRHDEIATLLLYLLRVFPFLVPLIIKMTHGKPMKV